MKQATQNKRRYGSPLGLLAVAAIGFAFYWLLPLVPSAEAAGYGYEGVVEGIGQSLPRQVLWFLINFTEPDFTAGALASLLMLAGGLVAWRLSVKGSRWQGTPICYGNTGAWPWVLLAQALSLFMTLYLFGHLSLFGEEGTHWAPTFIVVVSTPAAIVLAYGHSLPTLLTAALLPAAVATPLAVWLGDTLVRALQLPGGVANLLSMGLSGFAVMAVCLALPWMAHTEAPPAPAQKEDVHTAAWFVRRVLADFTEPHFYGNEIASAFMLAGAVADWAISKHHGASGLAGDYLPAILLSQFLSGGVGVFLYAHKFENGGWYGTFVPMVSAAPFCVLEFGTSLPVVLFAAVLSGVIGAPLAAVLAAGLPRGIHPFVANVLAMALCTAVVWAALSMAV